MGGGRGMGGGGWGGRREPGAGGFPQRPQTGSWSSENQFTEERNTETGLPPSRTGVLSDVVAVVDEKLCLGCGTCRLVCPAGAIRTDTVAVVRRDACTGCGRCVEACTHRAISLRGR